MAEKESGFGVITIGDIAVHSWFRLREKLARQLSGLWWKIFGSVQRSQQLQDILAGLCQRLNHERLQSRPFPSSVVCFEPASPSPVPIMLELRCYSPDEKCAH